MVSVTVYTIVNVLLALSGLQLPEIGPPRGKLLDVGNRKIHMNCTGSGSPTVVMEAGASAFSIDWLLVQPEIARSNRVCAYDRAGHAWSEQSTSIPTAARIAADLHAALRAAGEAPPYVMAAASMGGIYARIYQAEYPSEVAGMVFVDPVTEDRLYTFFRGQGVMIASLTAEELKSTIRPGTIRLSRRPPQKGSPFDRLPGDLYELRVQLDTRLIASQPETLTSEQLLESSEGERAALARLMEMRKSSEHYLGSLPVVVLTRGLDSNEDFRKAHAGLAALSTNSRHTIVADAGHEIHLFKPAAVIQAIRDVLEAVRTKQQLR
jgi:pimeloyl-ACP methyl ester carboxylesterase